MTAKISCICITHNKDRALERAIRCFKSQTYNNKELFVLYEEGDDIASKTLEKYQNDSEIVIYKQSISPKKTLGELRNIAIKQSSGEYFCQWDDDDWHSAYRLEKLFLALKGKTSIILDQWFIFDTVNRQAYLSYIYPWEGSLLCEKDGQNEGDYYSQLAKGEDTFLIDNLRDNNQLQSIKLPYLYIYTYDGKNTWDRGHWQDIFDRSTPLEKWLSKDFEYIIEEKYSVEEASYRLKQLYENLITFS